jgi:hypothetical protein
MYNARAGASSQQGNIPRSTSERVDLFLSEGENPRVKRDVKDDICIIYYKNTPISCRVLSRKFRAITRNSYIFRAGFPSTIYTMAHIILIFFVHFPLTCCPG